MTTITCFNPKISVWAARGLVPAHGLLLAGMRSL
jgi:hypothetical protein